jgi:hypothetical protein
MGKIENKTNWWRQIRFINVVVIVLVIANGLAYLVGINNLVVKGFTLQELKKNLEIVANDNQKIETEKVGLESYSNIEEKLRALKMVPIEKVEYIVAKDDIIAKK